MIAVYLEYFSSIASIIILVSQVNMITLALAVSCALYTAREVMKNRVVKHY